MTKVLPMPKLMLRFRRPTSIEGFETAWSAEFVPSAEQMPGIRRVAVSRAVESLAGPADLYLVHEFFFDSLASARQAMASAAGPAPGRAAVRCPPPAPPPPLPPPPPAAAPPRVGGGGGRGPKPPLPPAGPPPGEGAARAVG